MPRSRARTTRPSDSVRLEAMPLRKIRSQPSQAIDSPSRQRLHEGESGFVMQAVCQFEIALDKQLRDGRRVFEQVRTRRKPSRNWQARAPELLGSGSGFSREL